MPEFRFYATRDESLQMLRTLLAGGDLRVFPGEQLLDEPTPKVHTSLTADLEQDLRANPKLYLSGPFSMQPPYLAKLRGGPSAGRYLLFDDSGGPHVIFLLPSLRDGILLEGRIWTQPHYWLTATLSTGPTPALKAAYADMVKQLKQHLVRWQGLWLSPGALQLLKDGQAELPGKDKPLGVLARAAAKLPQLKPVPPPPPSSRKTTRRKVAARTAAP